jgi:hypothetical protein
LLDEVGRDEPCSWHPAQGPKDARIIHPFGNDRLDEIFLVPHDINYAQIRGRSLLGAPLPLAYVLRGVVTHPWFSLFRRRFLVLEVGLEPTLPEGNRILSPLHSETGTDMEGYRETKPRFYQGSGVVEGTGSDRERHPVAVGLRSE